MIKEHLTSLIVACGYDFITACELANKYITEIKARPAGKYTYCCKAGEITIKRN